MRKTALVTGASGGIGLEISKVLAREKYDLWLVSRDEKKLSALKGELERFGVSIRIAPKDLALSSAANELFDMTQKEGVFIELLVNNAGAGDFGLFAEVPLSQHERILNLNSVSLTKMTHLFLGPMLEKKRGKILNVASTAAFQPGPLLAVYYASKAYVLHFTEALAEELKGTGVSASVLCPGPTSTGFQKSAQMTESRLFKRAVMSAERVAEDGYRGLIQGKKIIVPGFRNKILSRSYRFFPRALVAAVVRKLQEKTASR